MLDNLSANSPNDLQPPYLPAWTTAMESTKQHFSIFCASKVGRGSGTYLSNTSSITLFLHHASVPSDLANDHGTTESSCWNISGKLIFLFWDITTNRPNILRSAFKSTDLSWNGIFAVFFKEENVFNFFLMIGWNKLLLSSEKRVLTNSSTNSWPFDCALRRLSVISSLATTPVDTLIRCFPGVLKGFSNDWICLLNFSTSFSCLESRTLPLSIWDVLLSPCSPHIPLTSSVIFALSDAVTCHLSVASWFCVNPFRPPVVLECLLSDCSSLRSVHTWLKILSDPFLGSYQMWTLEKHSVLFLEEAAYQLDIL